MLPEQAREVKSLLIQKGITQKRVAEIAGVQTSVVSSVINGRFRSYKVEKVITEITHKIVLIVKPTSTLVKKYGNPNIKTVLEIKQIIDLLAWKPKPGNLIILNSINVIINSLIKPSIKAIRRTIMSLVIDRYKASNP